MIVKGILDENISKYNVLKTLSTNTRENLFFRNKIEEFRNNSNLDMIYVNNNFIESLDLEENNRLDSNFSYISHKIGDKYVRPQGFYSYLKGPVEYYDGEKITTIDQLNKNEVLISMPYLKSYTHTTHYEDYKAAIRKNCDDTLEFNECVFKFLNDNKVIGSNLDIEVSEISQNEITKKEYKNLKIVGYELNAYSEVYSKGLLKQYVHDGKEIVALKIYEDDYDKLKKIVN